MYKHKSPKETETFFLVLFSLLLSHSMFFVCCYFCCWWWTLCGWKNTIYEIHKFHFSQKLQTYKILFHAAMFTTLNFIIRIFQVEGEWHRKKGNFLLIV